MNRLEQAQQGDIPATRASRRFNAKRSAAPKQITALDNAVTAYEEARIEYNQIVAGNRKNRSLAETLYRGNPFCHIFTDKARSLFEAAQIAKRYSSDNPGITQLLKTAIFNRKVRGVSLADVESLSTALSLEDIKGINRLIRNNFFSQFTLKGNDRVVQNIAINLPTLDLARPGEVVIPPQLRPLRDRMRAYFDYYVEFIRSPLIDSQQELGFLKALAFTGSNLIQGLGCYMPARLGITPASALKLFDEKVSLQPSSIAWRVFKKRIEQEITNAYRADTLPEALRSYQHYNPKADLRAATLLLPYYQNALTTVEQTGGLLEPEEIFSKFRRYQRPLRADILRSKDKFLKVSVCHPVISEVTIATQYKQTMIFVLFLSDNQTRLTIEVNGDNRIYGIPGNLYRENPHVGDLLISDVLRPVLDYAKVQHPEIEPVQTIVVKSIAPDKTVPNVDLLTDQTEQGEIVPRPLKRKNSLPKLFTEPPLPESVKLDKPKNRVDYSRDLIIKLLKDRVSNRTIDQIMRDIRKFELGEKQAEELKEVPNYFRLVSGNYRVILEHQGSSRYILRDAKNRSIVYRDLSRFK